MSRPIREQCCCCWYKLFAPNQKLVYTQILCLYTIFARYTVLIQQEFNSRWFNLKVKYIALLPEQIVVQETIYQKVIVRFRRWKWFSESETEFEKVKVIIRKWKLVSGWRYFFEQKCESDVKKQNSFTWKLHREKRILLCRRRWPRGLFWEDPALGSRPPPLLVSQAFYTFWKLFHSNFAHILLWRYPSYKTVAGVNRERGCMFNSNLKVL